MNPSSLSFREATDRDPWDTLVDASPQGTVFSKTAFLQSLGAPFRRFVVTSADTPVALLAVIEDATANPVRFPFTPYQGILFAAEHVATARQQVQRQFAVTEYIIAALTQRYRGIGMALSWNFEDIRPFLWHNHGQPGGRFTAQPRYTAVLDLRSLNVENYPKDVRQCRRQELKKAAPYAINERADLGDFVRLYASTFARQGIALDDDTLGRVHSIAARALHDGYGRLSSCDTPDGIASMNLFLYDARRAYYLFAANEPELRRTGAATKLMFDSIFEAKRRGLGELDFVGVNSPARGDFKLSFNPDLKLYFELSYTASSAAAGVGAAPQ
jgi:hypothetical protein